MMQSEFVERTGFEPMGMEYEEIEAEYMGSAMDKDQFCKQWKKNGGIERLMRIRARRIEELEIAMNAGNKREDKLREEIGQKKDELWNKDGEILRLKKALESSEKENSKLKEEKEIRREIEDDLEAQITKATARANEAEKKLAVLKAAFAILTGKENEKDV